MAEQELERVRKREREKGRFMESTWFLTSVASHAYAPQSRTNRERRERRTRFTKCASTIWRLYFSFLCRHCFSFQFSFYIYPKPPHVRWTLSPALWFKWVNLFKTNTLIWFVCCCNEVFCVQIEAMPRWNALPQVFLCLIRFPFDRTRAINYNYVLNEDIMWFLFLFIFSFTSFNIQMSHWNSSYVG